MLCNYIWILLKVWLSSKIIKCLLLFRYRHVNACLLAHPDLKTQRHLCKWARSYLHLDILASKFPCFLFKEFELLYHEFAYVLIMEINDAKKSLLVLSRYKIMQILNSFFSIQINWIMQTIKMRNNAWNEKFLSLYWCFM